MKLQAKILLLILTTTILIFVLTIGYVSITFKNKALKDAKNLADLYAQESANKVAASFNTGMGLSRSLSSSFADLEKVPQEQRLPIYDDILKNIFIFTAKQK